LAQLWDEARAQITDHRCSTRPGIEVVMLRRLLTALSAAALAIACSSAVARADGGTTYSWVGSSQDPTADNHSWTDQRNWSPKGVPGDGDSVVIVQPDAAHCSASVDGVPTVSLVGFSMSQNPTLCGTGIRGGSISVTGTFDWNGGSLGTPVTVEAGAVGTISGTNGITDTLVQSMAVDGSLDLTGAASLFFGNDHPLGITVAAGGTLGSDGDSRLSALSCCNSPATIVNGGTLHVGSGTLQAAGVEIDQNGTVQVDAGALLDSMGGLVNATAGSHYAGAGTWRIENLARARMLGQQVLGAGFHLQLGTLGGDTGATLGGRFTLAGTGTFDWSTGTVGGTVTFGRAVHVHVSGTAVTNGRRQFAPTDPTSSATAPSQLTNHGTITLDDGATVSQASGTTITNASDGSLDFAPGTAITGSACCLATAVLANEGGHVSVDSAATSAPVVLTNLSFRDDAGTTSIASGQQLQLSHGPQHSLANSSVVGGGVLQDAGATAVSGTVSLADGADLALVTGGTLDGTATVDGDGVVQWTGGSMSGNLTLSPAQGTSIGGTALKSVAPAAGGAPSTVIVRSALDFAAGTSSTHDLLDLGASSLVVAGHTSVPAFAEIHAGTLTNRGILTVSAGTDHADRTGPTATTVNTGTISVASGTFAIVNTFQQNKGTLAFSATASGNGRLTVGQPASVAGTVRIVNHFRPAVGATLTVLTSSALTWTGNVQSAGTATATGHWVAAPSATALAVQWQANA
jgi:hypothetical protein